MKNYENYFRGWELVEDKSHYVVTEKNRSDFKYGDRVVVVCNAQGDFNIMPFQNLTKEEERLIERVDPKDILDE
jgi:hypothetical protein